MKTTDCQSANAARVSRTADEPIKWTAKMKRAFNEKEFYVGDINNFWRE